MNVDVTGWLMMRMAFSLATVTTRRIRRGGSGRRRDAGGGPAGDSSLEHVLRGTGCAEPGKGGGDAGWVSPVHCQARIADMPREVHFDFT